MALLHVDFFSDVLGMCTQMDVILPERTRGQIGMEGKRGDGKYPTLDIAGALKELHDYAIPRVFSDGPEAQA